MAPGSDLTCFWQSAHKQKRGAVMKKIAVILALAFALTTGMALTTAFGCGLLPLLSNDACFIVKDGTGQLPHLVAFSPPILLGGLLPMPELARTLTE